jgi:hypothetical protein
MDDYVNILQDSIDTSVNMKIFKNRNDALMGHIFNSKLHSHCAFFKLELCVSSQHEIFQFVAFLFKK